jgi:hypothetical protein
METTTVSFFGAFFIEKRNFFYYFLYTEKETKERSLHPLHRGVYIYLHRGSHIFKFSCKLHFKCISAYKIASQLHDHGISSPQRSYQNTLVSLLSFLDGQKYHKNTVFPQEQLAVISADNMLRWMNYKTFGTPFPGPDANPAGCRSSTIQFWKKSISFFIPNKHHPWDSLMEQSNPTRSREILDLIKFVKKKEVRRQGVPSQARRPLTLAEFRNVVQALKTGQGGEGSLAKYGVPAQMAFQFHLITWIDCICHFQRDNLKAHDRFPSQALKVKLNWSKNVLEEQDAPWQTVLGSLDSAFCMLLNLSLWLELSSRCSSPYVFIFSEDMTVPSGGDKGKQRAMDVLHVVLFDLDLDLEEGEVGMHSIQKCASTHVQWNGVSKMTKTLKDDGRPQAASLIDMIVSSCRLWTPKWRHLSALEAHAPTL